MRIILLTAALIGAGAILATKVVKERQAKTMAELKDNGVDSVAVGKSIALKVKPTYSCDHGDLDVIREDLSNDRKSPLLISIEPIFPEDKSFKPVTRRVTQRGFFKGGVVDMKLPATKGPTHLGLFVCKDNKKEGRCAGKDIHNLTKLQDRYFFQDERIVFDMKAQDKTYYFQYFVLDKGTMTFLTKENSFASVKTQVDRMVSTYQPASRQKKLGTIVKSNLLKLTSVPIETVPQNDKVDLNLVIPGYDEEGCKPEVVRLKRKVERISAIKRLPANLLPELK